MHSVSLLDAGRDAGGDAGGVGGDGRELDLSFSRPAASNPGSIKSKKDPSEFYKAVCSSRSEPSLFVSLPEARDQVRLEISFTVSAPTTSGYICSWNIGGDALSQCAPPSSWVPCLDAPDALVETMELQLLVPPSTVGVASGNLVSIQRSSMLENWTLYQYQMPYACSACDVVFAVGELVLSTAGDGLEDPGGPGAPIINHFVPRGVGNRDAKNDMAHLMAFDRMVFGVLSQALGGATPTLSTLNIVFLPRAAMPAPLQQGVGFQAICMDDVPPVDCIESSLQLRCDIALSLAKQWFGFWVRSASFNDNWMVVALQQWLGDQFVLKCVGKTDYLYRRYQRHVAVAEMDNGEAPPLAGASFFGTHALDFTKFYSSKAAVVLSMMENRAGEQLFKKQVESFFSKEQLVFRAKEFFEDLAKAGDYANEVDPFLERWVFGCGAPMVSIGVQYTKRGSKLDVGLKQIGCDAAFHSAAKAEKTMGVAGVIKVGVQEGSGNKVDHPLHLGTKGYLAKSLSVNPLVKKIAGKRGRKKKSEEALIESKKAALINAQHPVQFVRLDPSSEFLCLKYVHQPLRMIMNKLRNSRDVVSQAEAIKELSMAPAEAAIEGLVECLEDENNQFHWTIRCEAARALSPMIGMDGSSLGATALLSFYRRRFYDADGETPLRVHFSTIEDYFVTETVLLSLTKCKFDFDVISFFVECLDGLWVGEMNVDNRSLLAMFMTCVGRLGPKKSDLTSEDEVQLAEFIHTKAFDILDRYLNMDLADDDGRNWTISSDAPGSASPSGRFAVAKACVTGMAALVTSGTCSPEIVNRATSRLEALVAGDATPDGVVEAGCGALARMKTAFCSFEDALSWGLEVSRNRREPRVALRIWEELMGVASRGTKVDWDRLERFIARENGDRLLQHAAFVVAAIVMGKRVWVWELTDKKKTHIALKVDLKASVAASEGQQEHQQVTSEAPEKEPRPKKISLIVSKQAGNADSKEEGVPAAPAAPDVPAAPGVPDVPAAAAHAPTPPATKIKLGGMKLKLKLGQTKTNGEKTT